MKDIAFLEKILQERGAPGYEKRVAKMIAKEFKSLGLSPRVDKFYNVSATMGEGDIHVLVVAHIDEIAMMVTSIEDDGFLGFCSLGGIDARMLLAQEVSVGENEIYGIIGAKPPHVLSIQERKVALKMDEIFIDIGYSKEKAKKKIKIGDVICLKSKPVHLLGDRLASKSLDDRMGIQIMIETISQLSDIDLPCKVTFQGSVNEEIGGGGASRWAYDKNIDIAVVIDVTFAKEKNSKEFITHDMDKPNIMIAPRCDRNLIKRIEKVAKEEEIEIAFDITGSSTGTDADSLQITGDGIACVVLGVPVKHMHSSVEMIDLKAITKTAQLLSKFLIDLKEV